MREIIERAKVYALYGADGDEVNLGAEIERLTAEKRDLALEYLILEGQGGELMIENKRLTAENVRLRGLVRGAFVEGWQAGFSAGASEDPLSENPDLDAWGDSRTRFALAETEDGE